MKHDVVIIGGGLAGLALAIDLKKRGHRTLVIEKGNYPRQKVCGEYISMESLNYLHSLCPALKTLTLPRINKFLLSALGTAEFHTSLDLGGFGISRYLLENLLFMEAKNSGVDVIVNTKAIEVKLVSESSHYTVTTKSTEYSAQLVCNATGKKSNFEALSDKAHRSATNYVGVKYHVKTNRDESQIEIHNFPGGYCGISNVENTKSCLCYIVNSKMLNEVGNSISELEKKYLFQNKKLKKIFSTAEFITKEPVTISGVNFAIKAPIQNGVFYLGDSAGTIAPITGNGMSICLRSAFKLSIYIDNYLSKQISKQQLVENYQQFWMKEFSLRIRLSRYFQKLTEYPFLAKLAIKTFNIIPSLAKGVIKQTHGNPF